MGAERVRSQDKPQISEHALAKSFLPEKEPGQQPTLSSWSRLVKKPTDVCHSGPAKVMFATVVQLDSPFCTLFGIVFS